ncbi:MAG: [Fe-Fe] hydrogenase large subunit C-terminal domain-containing protein [Sphaerochaetaceae bacterium]
MMRDETFFHSLTVKENICQGCTHCMKVCPTEAIRITGGKARINYERCVDCGQCMDVCPHSAIIIEQNDLNQIYSYQYRVALIPSVLIGQFEDEISEQQIIGALGEVGFTHIYYSEFGVDILRTLGANISVYADQNPVVSSYCPASVRLIQIRYPNLLPNVNLVRTPAQITALYVRSYLESLGANSKEVGIFYITPCAAKYAQIKTPGSATSGLIQGGLNLDYIFNLIKKQLSSTGKKERLSKLKIEIPPVTKGAFLWSLTKGESSLMQGRTLSVDELHNVIEFLELLEDERSKNFDFLELRACATGCSGGILTPRNRFLATERMKHHAAKLPNDLPQNLKDEIMKTGQHLIRNIKYNRVKPINSLQLDVNTSEAIKKMEKASRIEDVLPGIDCGLCGSPTCKALAEDIVRGLASIRRCLVLKVKDPGGLNHLARIWGEAVGKELNDAPVVTPKEEV